MSSVAHAPLIEPLTGREQEVLELLAQGKSDRQLAGELVLSLHTVKWYNRQIYGKLGVENREAAVARARLLGLVAGAGQERPDHYLPLPLNPFLGAVPPPQNYTYTEPHLAPGGGGPPPAPPETPPVVSAYTGDRHDHPPCGLLLPRRRGHGL